MKLINNKEFGGERPLFTIRDTRLENITITDGESGIKQCRNIEAKDCRFYGKYPWWHVDGALIEDCYFAEGSRSAIWYTNDLVMRRCRIDGPKFFREMRNVELEDVRICDADETFWKVDGLKLKNVRLVNCHLAGEQLLCYTQNLVLENCTFDRLCDRVFEYSTVEADIRGHIENIKNPTSGHIVADSIGSITIDENVRQPANCIIETRK